jgi:DNA-directed RNA polymerase subunit B
MTPIVNKKEMETVEVLLGELPIMVKSKFCPLSRMSKEELIAVGEDPDDPGGYFIVNGTERVIVSIEEIAPNRMILEEGEGSYPQILRINSERSGFVQKHLLERKSDGMIFISFANIKRLPIVVLFKALGLETDKEILEAIGGGEEIHNEIYTNLYGIEVATQKEAFEFIGKVLKLPKKQIKERISQLLDKYLLPHLGQETRIRKEKAKYLALAVKKLILLALGKIRKDDLDHYANKRLKMAGDLLDVLFRSILIGRWGLIARINYNYQKLAKRGKLPPVQTVVEANVVTSQLVSALATGSWVGGRTGVSQRLERLNFMRTQSHLRSVISPLTSTQEHFEARELHATQFGRLCPAETPEGPTIGLRKYLALTAQITKGLSELEKRKLVNAIKPLEEASENAYLVLLDGTPIGYVENGKGLVDEIRRKRRNGLLNHEVNIVLYEDMKEVRINTDSGRVRRPLIIVEDGKPKLTEEYIEKLRKKEIGWNDLIELGIIEYLDAEEEENALVALSEKDLTEKHTHLEISPLCALGLNASLIAFPEYNRGDRVNYGAKMVSQSIGLYQSNFFLRTDTKCNVLNYPQVPIVQSASLNATGLNHHPAGQNVVIAVMTYQGYNMEDAIIFNKASIERGLFRSTFFRTYSCEERRYSGGQEDIIGIPEKDVRGYRSEEAYAHLSEDGIINLETVVGENDVLVARTSPLRFLGSTAEFITGIGNRRETSVCVRHKEHGIVDRVFITESANGNKFVKVIVRDNRIPEVGDKFASRHGQKGVIGLIVPQEDMPFSASGIVPDIIFNPHGIPTRQTIGQWLETLAGKVAALEGRVVNGSGFEGEKEYDLREALRKLGFRSDGKEVFYSGITGKKFEAEIFTGIIYYQKLDHMVADKIHARSRGPVTLLTKQPTEGRAKEGGLRLGEMEKDCLIAHGAVLTLKERFSSDEATLPVCKDCGIIAIDNKVKGKRYCPICKGSNIVDVKMSYAFKLLLDELRSMLIYPKINVKG